MNREDTLWSCQSPSDYQGERQFRTAYSVDQRIKYMPALANTAATAHTQNMASMVWTSHGPVCGMPYSQMLINIVPTLAEVSNSFLTSHGSTQNTYETSWGLVSHYITRGMSILCFHILTEAGMNSASIWSVKECMKLPGRRRNLMRRRILRVANRHMLKIKNMTPTT